MWKRFHFIFCIVGGTLTFSVVNKACDEHSCAEKAIINRQVSKNFKIEEKTFKIYLTVYIFAECLFYSLAILPTDPFFTWNFFYLSSII